jgi:hypothetical protein
MAVGVGAYLRFVASEVWTGLCVGIFIAEQVNRCLNGTWMTLGVVSLRRSNPSQATGQEGNRTRA